MHNNIPGAESTTPSTIRHCCSESGCRQPLETFVLGAATFGTCNNPLCRLNGVTLDVVALAALTEPERQHWDAVNARHRHFYEQREREAAERMAKLPAHLRRIG